jgi:hypothetical protein
MSSQGAIEKLSDCADLLESLPKHASTAKMTYLDSAKKKLTDSLEPFPLESLPKHASSAIWDKIFSFYHLSLPEQSELQNMACLGKTSLMLQITNPSPDFVFNVFCFFLAPLPQTNTGKLII